MRKFIVVALLLFVSVTTISAATYSTNLPSGKNYLDSNNFLYGDNTLSTISAFKVKENQTYTLTVPREVEYMAVQVFGDEELLDGNSWELPECTDEIDRTYCTFTTTSETTNIQITIHGGYLSDYLEQYGMYRFQLEEGSISTEYEGYIPPEDVSGPTVSGTGSYITTYKDQTPIENIVSSHVTAIDEKEGDVSDTIAIVTDDYTGNRSTIGEYSVIIQANDSQSNVTQFKLIVIVKDEIAPVFLGPDHVTTNVDNPEVLEALLANYSAVDEYDGELEIIVEEDDYTAHTSEIGTYAVTISSTDSSGNKETIPVSIVIEDTISPEITSSTLMTQNISTPISTMTILSNITTSDNYNVQADITKEITRDTYSVNNTSKGVYEIDVLLTDTSGNESTTTITITVIDDINPTITGPNSLVLSYKDIQEIEDIKLLFTLFDNETTFESSDLVVTANNYSVNSDQLGEYIMTLELTDESLNKTVKTVNIRVIDDVGPVLTTDDYIVSVSSAARVTNKDLVNILVKHNKVENKEYDVEVTLDEYTSNVTIPGSYKYQIDLIDKDGNIEHKDFVIKVEESIVVVESSNEMLLLARNIAAYTSIVAMLVIVTIKIRRK